MDTYIRIPRALARFLAVWQPRIARLNAWLDKESTMWQVLTIIAIALCFGMAGAGLSLVLPHGGLVR